MTTTEHCGADECGVDFSVFMPVCFVKAGSLRLTELMGNVRPGMVIPIDEPVSIIRTAGSVPLWSVE